MPARRKLMRYPTIVGIVLLGGLFPNTSVAFDFFEHEYIGEVVCRASIELRTDRKPSPESFDLIPDDSDGGPVCAHLVPVQIALAGDHVERFEDYFGYFSDYL